MTVGEGILVAVVGGLVLAAALALARRAPGWMGKALRSIIGGTRTLISLPRQSRRKALISKALQRAEVLGKGLPVSRTGYEPVMVTYSNGVRRGFFRNFETYIASVRAGLDPRAHFWQEPPDLVTDWSDERLREWLEKN